MNLTLRALALVLTVVPGLSASDARSASKRGVELIKAGKPQEALPWLTAAIRLDPRSASHYLHRAVAHADLKQHAQSLADVDRALEINPRYQLALFSRGNLCHLTGRYKQAIEHYDRALALSPPAALEKQIRQARAKSADDHDDVLRGKLRPPDVDVAKLAREALVRRDPLGFWKSVGSSESLTMTHEEPGEDGAVVRKSVTLECVRINLPRRGMAALPLYIPLERGDILRPTVEIGCHPGVAILSQTRELPAGHELHARLYLEWLYHKSGR